ncbi:hypothetical protein ACKFKG_18490 [Phormidesmis sp. 146-35]
MSLQGLPDFHHPIQTEEGPIFFAYETGGCFVLPNAVSIANRPDAQPDFALTLVRGQNPTLPPKPYGLLDFRLQPHYFLDAALAAVRQQNAQATVEPIGFQSGFLRLYPEVDNIPDDLKVPISLAWNGLTSARYSLKLSESTAIALKGALTGNILRLRGQAEMETIGVAPRLPIRVRFDPATLLNQLAALGNAQRQIACEDVLNFFRKDIRSLPLEAISTTPLEGFLEGFAEAMTDWIRAHFGTFIPSPIDDRRAYIALSSADHGSFKWDLSQPLQAYRTIVFSLDPLESARQLVQNQGLEAVFRELTVPPIPTGTWTIRASANLPDRRLGVIAIGVTLKSPPALPYRPQARIASAQFIPPDDTATLTLRLSPIEKLEYKFFTSVVLEDATGTRELKSEEITHQGERLSIRPDQFPVKFLMIEGTRSLLTLATLRGICRWQEAEQVNTQTFDLTAAASIIAIALPKDISNATLEIFAQSLEGNQTLHLDPFPAKSCQIGLHSFREYGVHQISVECEFSEAVKLWAIDLLPDGAPESEMTVLFFTPSQPQKTWSWLAKSPFRSGYRYRLHPTIGALPSDWSTLQSPFASLKIQTNSP